MEDGRRNLVVEIIGAAVLAGAYSQLAKEIPDAARGLEKLRDKHSERVQALAGEIAASAGRHAQALVALPTRARR